MYEAQPLPPPQAKYPYSKGQCVLLVKSTGPVCWAQILPVWPWTSDVACFSAVRTECARTMRAHVGAQ